MQGSRTNTRREALGIATLIASMIAIGDEAGAVQSRLETSAKTSARPTREELARATRFYAGEFGGGVGVR